MVFDQETLTSKVKELFDQDFKKYETDTVPDISDPQLTHGATGYEGEFTYLYVDMRGSSTFTGAHRRQTVSKIYKAFHLCMVETIKHENGKIRSFDGDRVMGIFDGSRKVNNAVEASMLMVGCLKDILQPKIKSYYSNENFEIGIGISTSKVMIIKAGVGYDDNNRDLVSIGTSANLAAKLSDQGSSPNRIYICDTSFSRLLDDNRWNIDTNSIKQNM